jgi:hypothetical protein
MIECSACLTWLHLKCAGLRRTNIPDTWHCSKCKQDVNKSETAVAKTTTTTTPTTTTTKVSGSRKRKASTKQKVVINKTKFAAADQLVPVNPGNPGNPVNNILPPNCEIDDEEISS